jgi:hypothetical protein
MVVIVEKFVEWKLVGETEVLGKIPAPVPLCLPQIPHDLTSNSDRRDGKPATNLLSYGTAQNICKLQMET